jgi:hypothetical protein
MIQYSGCPLAAEHSAKAWWVEGTLQLQRRAFEEMGIVGMGEWEFDE